MCRIKSVDRLLVRIEVEIGTRVTSALYSALRALMQALARCSASPRFSPLGAEISVRPSSETATGKHKPTLILITLRLVRRVLFAC